MVKGLSLLDTAHLYLGKVGIRADYEVDGERVLREREWEVQKGEKAVLKEEDWAAVDFHFGEAWRRRYDSRRSSET